MLVYTRCGIERLRGGGEGPGRTEEDIRKCFFFIFFFFVFLFLLHEDQSPGSIHSKDTQMLVARDDSVKIHRQLFVAGI